MAPGARPETSLRRQSMACVRCGDSNASHYVRLDTTGQVCVPCLIEELHDLREKVETLRETLDAERGMKNAAKQ